MNAMPKKSRFPSPPLAPVEMQTATIALMTRESPRENATRSRPPAANQSRAVSLSPGSYDEKTRSFQAVLSTGAAVKRSGYYEELSMDPAAVDLSRIGQGQCKLLDSHNQGSAGAVLGTVTSGRFEAGRLLGTVQLGESEAARALEPDIIAGHLRGVSIGYRVDQWTNVSAGDVETWRADKWTLMEASIVAVPADAGAMVRSAPEDDAGERNAPSAMTARQAMNLLDRADFYGERALAERMVRQGHDEKTIMQAVQESCRRAGDVAASIGGGPRPGLHREMNALGYRSDNEGYPYMHTNSAHNAQTLDNPEFARQMAEDAIFARLPGGRPPEGAARHFAGLRIDQYDDALAELRGEKRSWLSRGPGHWLSGTRGAGMTSSDLPILLQSASSRSLRATMAAMEGGSSAAVANMVLPDFREHTEVDVSTFPEMEKIEEGGEFTYGVISDGGEKIRIASYGKAINLTFQAMRNDDLGGMSAGIRTSATANANLKAKTIMAALSAVMSDGKALFHTDHGNLASSGGAPDETTLTNGRIAMRTQKAIGGNAILGLTPAIILCGPALETTVEKLIASINPTASDDVNVFAGKLRIAIEPRISGNEWYLFADPAIYPCVKFGTLAGFESPAFEQDQEFNRLGMSWRIHWHIGAAPVDYRGCWKNPGAGA
jgi:phage head maturation protease